MKKILMVLIILLSIILPNIRVYALEESFYEGEYIPNEYIIMIENNSIKYDQLRFIRRKSDDQAVYCIKLCEIFSNDRIITGYDYEQYNFANIDYGVWERIMLISYYGYGYQNHTDSKWYAITQYMIWKETLLDTSIYFTDTLNGNKIVKYQDEINEINSLIQNHANISSFYNQTFKVKYNESMTIQDTNHVLEKFDITSDGGLEVSKDGDYLTFTKNDIGESQIFFMNTGKLYSNLPIVYVDNNGQNILAPGSYYPIYMILNVTLESGNITVNKYDQDTQSNVVQGDASLSGTRIQLLDNDNRLISEKIILEDGKVIFENIGYGTYYLKEVEAGDGYLIDSSMIEVVVDSNKEVVDLYNEVIKNEIVLNKYLRNNLISEIKKEQNAVFSIFNSKNEFLKSVTTDENGQAKVVLPYGKYLIKQEFGTKNYSYASDIMIDVVENNIIQNIELYSDELTANIKIINVDDDSNLPILESGATFKIKNLSTNEYLIDNEKNILILTTNDLGNTEFLNLSSGKYEIEQLTSISGYEINESVFTFEIGDEIEFKFDNIRDKYLEIIISNIKHKVNIEIEELIKYYLNDDLEKIEDNDSILISIYAKEDIYSKDGIKIYDKDELVDIIDLKDDKIITIGLIFGKYYLKNSKNDRVVDIVLNKTGDNKIKFVEEVYEYQDTNTEYMLDFNNIYSVKESIEVSVENEDKNEEFVENVEEIEKNTRNESNIEILKNDIKVPNTYVNKSDFSIFNLLLIIIGLFLIKKGKKYEEN